MLIPFSNRGVGSEKSRIRTKRTPMGLTSCQPHFLIIQSLRLHPSEQRDLVNDESSSIRATGNDFLR